jgi:hypothetical protein
MWRVAPTSAAIFTVWAEAALRGVTKTTKNNNEITYLIFPWLGALGEVKPR